MALPASFYQLRQILSAVTLAWLVSSSPADGQHSIAREWNEENLSAIRISFPDPPVHARNLFHVSVAMWDAWAAYDETATGYVHNETATPPGDLEAARHEAISYAAYRVLNDRYVLHPHPDTPNENSLLIDTALKARMSAHTYPIEDDSLVGDSPSAVGNRVAAAVLAFAASDASNESNGYTDPTYSAVNPPLIISNRGTNMIDPNRWQPLAFAFRFTQNGIQADEIQTFVGAHWGDVRPFALHLPEGETQYHDPHTPPQLGGEGDAAFRENNLEVVRFSSQLDPDDGTMIDLSPGAIGNNPLGLNTGSGHPLNPATSSPYEANETKLADYGRVVAEFWADGPHSETPPGHWNVLANEVADHPDFALRIGGEGPEVDRLEWDVKVYFAINGAVHDVAVAIWGCKRAYDYVRPISSIRYLGQNGQLPIEAGLCELITIENSAPGEKFEAFGAHVGENAILAWAGEPGDPENEWGGVDWILAADWLPYQRDTFVTPAFAGYTSGHSGFSRAAAEVLTAMTGSAFFPGGIGSHTVLPGELEFEYGPSEAVTLQWGTYFDAADEAGISRLYGGIHVAPDDGPGRVIGSACGIDAWNLAASYFDGSINTASEPSWLEWLPNGDLKFSWYQSRGMFYTLQWSHSLEDFTILSAPTRAVDDTGELIMSSSWVQGTGRGFLRVKRSDRPLR